MSNKNNRRNLAPNHDQADLGDNNLDALIHGDNTGSGDNNLDNTAAPEAASKPKRKYNNDPNKVLISFERGKSPRVFTDLDNIKKRLGGGKTRDLIERALSIYALVLEEEQEGRKMVFEDAEGQITRIRFL